MTNAKVGGQDYGLADLVSIRQVWPSLIPHTMDPKFNKSVQPLPEPSLLRVQDYAIVYQQAFQVS